MDVFIKDFAVKMEVKTKGIELQVNEPSGKQLGDLIVKKSGLEWCKGRTSTGNGVSISWRKFIEYMEDK